MICPPMASLSKFAAAQLEGGEVAVVGLHVADCARCRGVLATLAGQPPGEVRVSGNTDLSAATLQPPRAQTVRTANALDELQPVKMPPLQRALLYAGVAVVVIGAVAAVIWNSL